MQFKQMALSDDEFEPLFNYTGAHQPFIQIDESESEDDAIAAPNKSWRTSVKRQNNADLPLKRKSKDQSPVKRNPQSAEVENDENWLPSPPKLARLCPQATCTDSTILLLRQKKAELLSITEKASEASVALAESEAINLDEQFKSFESQQPVAAGQESTKKKRDKVVVMVQDKNGDCRPFRIYMDDKFEKLYHAYAQAIGKNMADFVFRFDGEQVTSGLTPKDLGLEAEDIVEVHHKACQ
ncbi:hypothetical protein O6H91_13G035200 [Diphasiastrum complanatum]|uniref:Uncharacterized protein n=1 Tax=Diphasiastrum complanatum TaxID=34168 RepID=A0ACC2BUD7_DIPCM|nr:hypothetical protein O6H91_13G035200 [Diphasiastrum complanatum]